MYYYKLTVEEYTIYLYPSSIIDKDRMEEARHRGKPLRGPYSVKEHPPHGAFGQDHLHVYNKNNEIFAINKDGTAHDQSHGCHIPNKAADALRSMFPDYYIPNDNIIESAGISYARILIEQTVAFDPSYSSPK